MTLPVLLPVLLPLRLSSPERWAMGELDPPPLLGPLSRLATLSHAPASLTRRTEAGMCMLACSGA